MVLPCHLRPAQTDAYDAIEIGNSLIDAIVLSPPSASRAEASRTHPIFKAATDGLRGQIRPPPAVTWLNGLLQASSCPGSSGTPAPRLCTPKQAPRNAAAKCVSTTWSQPPPTPSTR